jgi:hypothetical protein
MILEKRYRFMLEYPLNYWRTGFGHMILEKRYRFMLEYPLNDVQLTVKPGCTCVCVCVRSTVRRYRGSRVLHWATTQ